MSIVVHNFDQPDRFVAGTVGAPGQRTFFVQARAGNRLTSVAMEKQQVSILAERLDQLLDEALRQSGGDSVIPAVAPIELRDNEPLDQPIVEEFRVGTITLSWESETSQVVLEFFPVTDETIVVEDDDLDDLDEGDGLLDDGDDYDDDDEVVAVEVEASEVFIVKIDPAHARAFVSRAESVVSAGRPACQFCGGPLDPEGHLCPRANGFKRIVE